MNIVQQNQAASQSQTGFYSWFQMPCGTSGTAVTNNQLAFKLIQPNGMGDISVCSDVYTECTSPDFMNYIGDVTSMHGPIWNPLSINTPNLITHTEFADMPQYIMDCQSMYYKTAITTSATEVVIFPNPAKEHLNIKLNGVASDLKITLVDITGRIVAKLYDNDSEETKISLALPPLANGVYLVNIELNNTRLPIQKITINN